MNLVELFREPMRFAAGLPAIIEPARVAAGIPACRRGAASSRPESAPARGQAAETSTRVGEMGCGAGRQDAVLYGSQDGCRYAGRVTTYAQLDRASRRVAVMLREKGVVRDDRVLVLVPMSGDLYAILMAIWRIGAIAMFVDPGAGRKHLERCCELCSPSVFVGTIRAQLLRFICPSLRRSRVKVAVGGWFPGAVSLNPFSGSESLAMPEIVEPVADGDPALLTFTSGSTGEPKPVWRTHGFLRAQYEVLRKHLELQPGEVDLATLPIFALANLAAGVSSVIPDADMRRPGSIRAERVLAQIEDLGVNRVGAAPAFLERLADGAESADIRLRRVTKIFTGGGPVFPRLIERISAFAPNAQVTAVYGSSEAEPMAVLPIEEISRSDLKAMMCGKGLLAGRVVPELQLRILKCVGERGEASFVAQGEAGEIVVRGNHVLTERKPGVLANETKIALKGEVWHRTGDAGYLDGSGRLWLLGRMSGRIEDDRGVLFPFQVECAAMQRNGVRRAALFGCLGKRILAIELSGGHDTSGGIPAPADFPWAQLDEVRCVKRIPVDRRHNAKIDYSRLRSRECIREGRPRL